MTGRIKEICSNLPVVGCLADVGCDHGYCTKYAFDHHLCERAYISDISAGILEKAQKLLAKEIGAGKCIPCVGDGLQKIGACDCVLLAGLGGEEIIRILSERALPAQFVLQPMRNSEKVRAFLLARGAKIERDYTFGDGGYYYDLITGTGSGGDTYSDYEILFGRENLKRLPEAFLKRLFEEREKTKARMGGQMSRKSREELVRRLSVLEVVTDAIEGNI